MKRLTQGSECRWAGFRTGNATQYHERIISINLANARPTSGGTSVTIVPAKKMLAKWLAPCRCSASMACGREVRPIPAMNTMRPRFGNRRCAGSGIAPKTG